MITLINEKNFFPYQEVGVEKSIARTLVGTGWGSPVSLIDWRPRGKKDKQKWETDGD